MQKAFERLGEAFKFTGLAMMSIIVIGLFTAPVWAALFNQEIYSWLAANEWDSWIFWLIAIVPHLLAGVAASIIEAEVSDDNPICDLAKAATWCFAREAYIIAISALVVVAGGGVYGLVLLWAKLNVLWGPVIASLPTGAPLLVSISFGVKFKLQFGRWIAHERTAEEKQVAEHDMEWYHRVLMGPVDLVEALAAGVIGMVASLIITIIFTPLFIAQQSYAYVIRDVVASDELLQRLKKWAPKNYKAFTRLPLLLPFGAVLLMHKLCMRRTITYVALRLAADARTDALDRKLEELREVYEVGYGGILDTFKTKAEIDLHNQVDNQRLSVIRRMRTIIVNPGRHINNGTFAASDVPLEIQDNEVTAILVDNIH